MQVYIYEEIDLSPEEANDCWDYDFMNEPDLINDPGEVLKLIISDKELSVEQKVYLTWIFAYTLEKRKELKEHEDSAW